MITVGHRFQSSKRVSNINVHTPLSLILARFKQVYCYNETSTGTFVPSSVKVLVRIL